MQPTALRRIDAITKKPNSTFLKNKHPICRTVQLCRISITCCVSCYVYKCTTEKGPFKICLDHFFVGLFPQKPNSAFSVGIESINKDPVRQYVLLHNKEYLFIPMGPDKERLYKKGLLNIIYSYYG